MNKLIISGIAIAAASLMPSEASADITVKLSDGCALDSISYYNAPIRNIANAKSRDELGMNEGTLAVKDSQATIPVGAEPGGYRYGISVGGDKNIIDLYASQGDNITIDVTSLSPLSYTLSGTPLAEGISTLVAMSAPLEEKQRALMAQGEPDQQQMMAIYEEYIEGLKEYINENPTAEAAAYAVMNLQGEDMIKAFDNLSERARSSIIFPLAEAKYLRAKESLEKERRQQEMASGSFDAPAFALADINGKNVSLADFKGKWVILDFWGSWCIWCIKGFPELKEAHEKYGDRLAIIGIDCNETQEAWKAGVEKYELPWVNLYCPEGDPLIAAYGIQGFPTKAIIDPTGKIRNITTGHNPDFFNILSGLMSE